MKIRKDSLLHQDHLNDDYVDSYEFVIIDKNNKIGLIDIAESFIKPGPRWVEWLLAIRDKVVSVFNLKTSDTYVRENDRNRWEPGAQAGMFKVFDRTATEIVLGGDDKHLDFRVSLFLESDGLHKKVTVTTAVKYHNRLGRCYFFFVKPAHRIIVPLTLKQKFKELEQERNER